MSVDAGVQQTVKADSLETWELAEDVKRLCAYMLVAQQICASTSRAVLVVAQLMRKHRRPWVIAFSRAPFKSRKPLWKWCHKGSPKWVVLSTQFLAFRQLSFQFNNTESYLLFLPFKSPRYLSCPLLMQSKKGFKTLSSQESRKSFSSKGITPAGAQSQSKEQWWDLCEERGALGRGVAFLAIYLLETSLLKQVLCWELTPGF